MDKRAGTARGAGQAAAVYCRISRAGDDDQTGVERQERLCREIAERLGLDVAPERVFVDNNRSAWQRNRKRPGWDALLEEMATGQVRHVIVYHADRLMRQPRDLEELLAIADDQRIVLHGQANRKDLSDSDDRFILRIEVAHACRSSDDTSRRTKAALADRRRNGDPHGRLRRLGYASDGRTIIEEEAEIVREVFRRYLEGETASAIARDLHERGLRSVAGSVWQEQMVRKLINSPHVAGILTYYGERVGMGNWPAIIDLGQWEEAQQVAAFRAAQHKHNVHQRRYYLLRGVITCTCGHRMVGSSSARGTLYRCVSHIRNGSVRCQRAIAAESLERFCADVAIGVLEGLDISGRPAATVTRPQADIDADEADAAQLRELNEMWLAQEIRTPEYRAMRRRIEERISERQRRTVQRPVAVLEGIVGPDARARWRELEQAEDWGRINALFRFLFAAVIIHPATKKGPTLDYDRIQIEPNPLD